MTTHTFEETLQNVRNRSWRVHHRGTLKIIDRKKNSVTQKTTTTGRDAKTGNIDITFLLMRNYKMTGQHMFYYLHYLCQIKKTAFLRNRKSV
jgi:hypothetical protein